MTTSQKITWRQQKQKALFLEQLGKTPIISLVAEKTWIPRSTYYRWTTEDPQFWRDAYEIYTEWLQWLNDMAVSQLMKLIKEWDRHALIFWLRMRDPEFGGMLTRREDPKKTDTLSEQEKKKKLKWLLREEIVASLARVKASEKEREKEQENEQEKERGHFNWKSFVSRYEDEEEKDEE